LKQQVFHLIRSALLSSAHNVNGLSPSIPYVLKRSGNLTDGFPVTIGTPFYATDPPSSLADPAPPPGKAFYRIEPAR